jgi:hypothetical protein
MMTAAGSFPRHASEIERAYDESGEFRSICADMLVCEKALVHWNKVNTDDGAARREEYGELLESLKQEVLDWLVIHGYLREDEVQG